MSRIGLISAGIYFTIATGVVIWEFMSPPSGGWISLRNMGAFPAACTGLIYKVVALIAGLFTSR